MLVEQGQQQNRLTKSPCPMTRAVITVNLKILRRVFDKFNGIAE